MKAKDDKLIFASGRTVYANAGIVGLCINDDPEFGAGLSYGYDGGISLPEDSAKDRLTAAECVELAEEMLSRWTAFRAKYAGSD